MRLIDADAFVARQRELYCTDCHRRKNGKGKLVYEIGDAPCRACELDDALDAVDDAPTVDAVRCGAWTTDREIAGKPVWSCSECTYQTFEQTPYCPMCGAKMG